MQGLLLLSIVRSCGGSEAPEATLTLKLLGALAMGARAHPALIEHQSPSVSSVCSFAQVLQ